jgi:hypothetical protein
MSISKSKKVVLATIAVFSIVGLIWFALAHLPSTGSVFASWPTKSTHTLLMRPADSKESSRLVDFAPDQQTITAMRIEYRDGRTALVTYENGQPTAINTYFAEAQPTAQTPADTIKALQALRHLSDGLATRQLQSLIVFKADGKTIKSLTSYRQDGNYAAVGVRDSADDFAVTIYGNGTTGVSGLAVFSGTDGSLKSEQDFRDDGTIQSSFTTQDTGGSGAKETFFDASGNKTKEVLFDGDNVSINEFAADGKTVVAKTSFGYSGVTVTSYDATGTQVTEERNYVDSTHISVRYFDNAGNATMKQIWIKADPAIPADQVGVVNDGFYLDEVYEYHSDGSSTKVDVSFYPGGKIVKEYLTRSTTSYRPSVDQHFRADGSLDYTETCGDEGDSWTPCNTTKMPDGPNKTRVNVPASYSKVTPLLPAPTVQKPTIPNMPLTVDLR